MLRIPFVHRRVLPAYPATTTVLSYRARVFAALVGIGLLALLMVASRLRPSPRGWGTHEQLGLPPCTVMAIVGLRCPACGMTTSWALATQGRLAEALRVHVAGTALAGLAALTSVAALVASARGKWFAWQVNDTVIAALGLMAVAVVLFEWLVRLARG